MINEQLWRMTHFIFIILWTRKYSFWMNNAFDSMCFFFALRASRENIYSRAHRIAQSVCLMYILSKVCGFRYDAVIVVVATEALGHCVYININIHQIQKRIKYEINEYFRTWNYTYEKLHTKMERTGIFLTLSRSAHATAWFAFRTKLFSPWTNI